MGGPVVSSRTDELRTMNAQLEASNSKLWEVLGYLAGHLSHAGKRCKDLERQLEQERSALPIVADAVEESTLRRLGLSPAPRQKTTPRHRRGHLHGVNVVLFAVVVSLSVFRPFISAGPPVHRPIAAGAARRRPAPLSASVYGYPLRVALPNLG